MATFEGVPHLTCKEIRGFTVIYDFSQISVLAICDA